MNHYGQLLKLASGLTNHDNEEEEKEPGKGYGEQAQVNGKRAGTLRPE